jgi:hypothetical protein
MQRTTGVTWFEMRVVCAFEGSDAAVLGGVPTQVQLVYMDPPSGGCGQRAMCR